MSYPKTYSAFRRTSGILPHTIEPYQENNSTEIGPHEILIKIRAVSLNYRGVDILTGKYLMPCREGRMPCSDAAAEVIATGSVIKAFVVGDRVAPIATTGNYEDTDDGISEGSGVNVHGFLREYAMCQEKHLVNLQRDMSWEEVSFAEY
jgi:NADPH:quinone reductase-like Zn-dependent oxidoreductase